MLPVGTRAPNFALYDQSGEECELAKAWADGPVVLFFYPKDETAICTKEACGFRDEYQRFVDSGAQVFGISRDSVQSHASFAQHHRLPFCLLADQGGQVAKAFGVKKVLGLAPGRATYVIDTQGVIQLSFSSALAAQAHVDEALLVVKGLNRSS